MERLPLHVGDRRARRDRQSSPNVTMMWQRSSVTASCLSPGPEGSRYPFYSRNLLLIVWDGFSQAVALITTRCPRSTVMARSPESSIPNRSLNKLRIRWIRIVGAFIVVAAVAIGVGVGIWQSHGNRLFILFRCGWIPYRESFVFIHISSPSGSVLLASLKPENITTVYNTSLTIPFSQLWLLLMVIDNCTFKTILVLIR